MRLMALAHGAAMTVRAAHGRVIAVGEVVDFDEVIGTMGASYSLGVALGPDADKFEPAPAPVQEPEPEPVPVEPGSADMEPEPVDPPVVAPVQEPAPEPVPGEPAPAES